MSLTSDAKSPKSERHRDEITNDGAEAYRHGVPIHQPPHPTDTLEYKWWIEGYQNAEVEDDVV